MYGCGSNSCRQLPCLPAAGARCSSDSTRAPEPADGADSATMVLGPILLALPFAAGGDGHQVNAGRLPWVSEILAATELASKSMLDL